MVASGGADWMIVKPSRRSRRATVSFPPENSGGGKRSFAGKEPVGYPDDRLGVIHSAVMDHQVTARMTETILPQKSLAAERSHSATASRTWLRVRSARAIPAL